MTALEYTQPLGSDLDLSYTGLVVRAIDKDGQTVDASQQTYESWHSSGDPFTGEGYALAFKKDVPWLTRVFRIMCAESLPAEHAAARAKAAANRIAQAAA